MNDDDIVDKILAGWSLSTVMVPDPFLPSNRPEHLETVALPHVIVTGQSFWAKSEPVHFIHAPRIMEFGVCAWCYTNRGDHFCSYAPGPSSFRLMRRARYKRHEWRLHEDHGLIWDSDRGDSPKIVRDAVESGVKLRAALLDTEGVWNVHPADLSCFFPDEGIFQIKTGLDDYPMVFRSVKNMDDLVRADGPGTDDRL